MINSLLNSFHVWQKLCLFYLMRWFGVSWYFRGPRHEGGDRPRYADRDAYRGGPRGGGEFGGEKGGAPADYQPSFQVNSH